MQILGSLALGLISIYWVKKRRFERTTGCGTERFQSYQHKAWARLLDALLWGLGIGGLLSATLLIFVEYAPTWGFLILLLAVALAYESEYFNTRRRS